MKIKISSNGYFAEIEEADNWEETKERIIGALQRVLLSRDKKKLYTGVKNE